MVAGMLVGGGVNDAPLPEAAPMVVGRPTGAEPPMVVGTRPAAWLGMVAGILVGGVPPTLAGLPPIDDGV